MPQYVPVASNFQPSQVGSLYHVGISDGTNSYGYLFQPDLKVGMIERSNVADKSALIQYSSPNLIDRDLVYYPRVTQGDFSGGGLQEVLLNQNQYFDSDLETRTPGLVCLRPAWNRQLLTPAPASNYQCTSVGGKIYSLITGNLYDEHGNLILGGTITGAFYTDTDDGDVVILVSTTGSLQYYTPASSSWSGIYPLGHNVSQCWFIDLGTNGRFLYFTPDHQNLYRFDMNLLVTVQVPTSSHGWTIRDICPYQIGIAIATRGEAGSGQGGTSMIWYHDGQNMTRIIAIYGYDVVGMTHCLGNVFITANSTGGYDDPVLYMISSGSLTVVGKMGSPLINASGSRAGYPISSGQYVYFAVTVPQINNVTQGTYIMSYDSVNESFTHLPNYSADDNPGIAVPRQMAVSGRAVAFPMLDSSGNVQLQFQTNSTFLPPGNTYMSSGTLVSSKIDFSTPAIPKRFRRIEVQHAPLTLGQSVTVKAFVDQDPLNYSPSLTPVPSSARTTNSTVGSPQTVMTFGTPTVGKTLYYAVVLNGPGSTTPQLQYVAIEVGGTWTWEFTFDCSSKRRLLNGQGVDQQGVTGKDLYWLLRNAYENGTQLTLYLAENTSYLCQIESVDVISSSYTDHIEAPVKADQEWQVHVILNQVA